MSKVSNVRAILAFPYEGKPAGAKIVLAPHEAKEMFYTGRARLDVDAYKPVSKPVVETTDGDDA